MNRNTKPREIDPDAPPAWLANEAAARIRDGGLPQQVLSMKFAGPCSRKDCALCDEIVEPGELACEIASLNDAPLHLHANCFEAWENAARSMSPKAALVA